MKCLRKSTHVLLLDSTITCTNIILFYYERIKIYRISCIFSTSQYVHIRWYYDKIISSLCGNFFSSNDRTESDERGNDEKIWKWCILFKIQQMYFVYCVIIDSHPYKTQTDTKWIFFHKFRENSHKKKRHLDTSHVPNSLLKLHVLCTLHELY